MTDRPEEKLDPEAEAELRARREVVRKMLTAAAVTPMAAMLFHPKKALAAGEGSGSQEP